MRSLNELSARSGPIEPIDVTIMTMTTTYLRRLSALILCCATALVLTGWESPANAQVVVMVNGEPITNYDIEQRGKLISLSTHKPTDRQQVIDDNIKSRLASYFVAGT